MFDLETTITAVLHTVAYADLFDYPLQTQEIHRYLLGVSTPLNTLVPILTSSELIPHRLRYHQGYFTLPGREEIVQIRRERKVRSDALWKWARHYAGIFTQLPFIRMVSITGSLAVSNIDHNADIDYFLITTHQRVWLARAFVILIVRLAHHRHHLLLCPNYLLSENSLTLTHQNLYTARELAQMVPLSGISLYHQLRTHNPWTNQYLPNAHGVPFSIQPIPNGSKPIPSRLTETFLHTPIGSHLEQWEMQRKINKFRQAVNGYTEANFSTNYCKGHFHNHSRRILETYHQRITTNQQETNHQP